MIINPYLIQYAENNDLDSFAKLIPIELEYLDSKDINIVISYIINFDRLNFLQYLVENNIIELTENDALYAFSKNRIKILVYILNFTNKSFNKKLLNYIQFFDSIYNND